MDKDTGHSILWTSRLDPEQEEEEGRESVVVLGLYIVSGIFSSASAPWIVSHVKVRVTVRHREERVPVRAVRAAVWPAE